MWCFDPDGYLVVLDEPVPDQKAERAKNMQPNRHFLILTTLTYPC
jgi:hypothetical protein